MEYTGVFQGGGMKGLAYIGAICALEENGFTCIRSAGTSVGSIFASLLICGYSGKEMAYISKQLNFESFLYMPSKKISAFIQDKGLYQSSIIEYELDRLYSYKGYKMMSDLITDEGAIFKTAVTDATRKKSILFPDQLFEYNVRPSEFTIARAVTMSCLYPGFFKYLKLGNSVMVDGGVFNNLPLNAYHIEEGKLGIAFQILNKPKTIENPSYQGIKIDTSNVKTLKFKVTNVDKAKLFENGYVAGMKFVEEYYKKKLSY